MLIFDVVIHAIPIPVPGSGLYQIVEESKFNEENFNRAMAVFSAEESAETNAGMGAQGQPKKKRRQDSKGVNHQAIMQVMSHIILNNMHPCIVFVFAKAECEVLALALAKNNYNTEEEEKFVTETYHNAMESLSEDDRKLPAVQQLLPLLQRGVGIHHSGLLPMLKEVVELLFQAGLVKCLFSTETFSLGLNMPARTVVFSSVRKFDGVEKRHLTSGEYIQMSGRAGRRGLDRHGVAIIMLEEPLEINILRTMTSGAADELTLVLADQMALAGLQTSQEAIAAVLVEALAGSGAVAASDSLNAVIVDADTGTGTVDSADGFPAVVEEAWRLPSFVEINPNCTLTVT